MLNTKNILLKILLQSEDPNQSNTYFYQIKTNEQTDVIYVTSPITNTHAGIQQMPLLISVTNVQTERNK